MVIKEQGSLTGWEINLFLIYWHSATNRLITSKDHASVQINIGHLDENGIYTPPLLFEVSFVPSLWPFKK
ncbi:hypothetical protein UlMin_023783 [Ulmus minor]